MRHIWLVLISIVVLSACSAGRSGVEQSMQGYWYNDDVGWGLEILPDEVREIEEGTVRKTATEYMVIDRGDFHILAIMHQGESVNFAFRFTGENTMELTAPTPEMPTEFNDDDVIELTRR